MSLGHGEGRAWGFIAPAVLWTGAFFVVPFAVMAAMSLATLEGRTLVWGLHLDNYAKLLGQAFLARAIVRAIVRECLVHPGSTC